MGRRTSQCKPCGGENVVQAETEPAHQLSSFMILLYCLVLQMREIRLLFAGAGESTNSRRCRSYSVSRNCLPVDQACLQVECLVRVRWSGGRHRQAASRGGTRDVTMEECQNLFEINITKLAPACVVCSLGFVLKSSALVRLVPPACLFSSVVNNVE